MESLEYLAQFLGAFKDGYAMGGIVLALVLASLVIAKILLDHHRKKQDEDRMREQGRRYDLERSNTEFLRKAEHEKNRMANANEVFRREFGDKGPGE